MQRPAARLAFAAGSLAYFFGATPCLLGVISLEWAFTLGGLVAFPGGEWASEDSSGFWLGGV
jgi:hypothetical protein